MIYVMFQCVNADVIQCRATVTGQVNVAVSWASMERTVKNVYRYLDANMDTVMCHLNVSVIGAGMDYSATNVRITG